MKPYITYNDGKANVAIKFSNGEIKNVITYEDVAKEFNLTEDKKVDVFNLKSVTEINTTFFAYISLAEKVSDGLSIKNIPNYVQGTYDIHITQRRTLVYELLNDLLNVNRMLHEFKTRFLYNNETLSKEIVDKLNNEQ